MDGANNGEPYEQLAIWMIWGEFFPLFSRFLHVEFSKYSTGLTLPPSRQPASPHYPPSARGSDQPLSQRQR